MPEKFRIAGNIESSRSSREFEMLHNETVARNLEKEIEAIIARYELLGEGKAAKVFALEATVDAMPACAKIWRPELKHLSPAEYRERQYMSPEEEFDFQDKLYQDGFLRIPRPLVFDTVGNHEVMIMEKIPGYTFREIYDRGGTVASPAWHELEKLGISLNRKHGVIHRDLHLGNIMLKTDQHIEKHRKNLEGDLYLIDFGLSKHIMGEPTQEDYERNLTNSLESLCN